ncbi:MAG: hypothetical protein A2Y67_03425 [Candidatus Buchananbacteria bacterium RBG_13_39_9]|uniref:Uncharacterized protein n=1 Tax=Candidatus Buchananbacteria bacterium RBG_13_39_9 TaxID=1797531 RepID=A0A1G1XSQ7_9BACT|nr:MAG: hypothetical protein A2Y67_03425 [Candidatus Buchananbacteria bacterium RBG_13_39_9]
MATWSEAKEAERLVQQAADKHGEGTYHVKTSSGTSFVGHASCINGCMGQLTGFVHKVDYVKENK